MSRLFALLLFIVLQIAGPACADDSGREKWLQEVRALLQGAAQGEASARATLDAMFVGEIPQPFRFYAPHVPLARDFYRYGAERGNLQAMHYLGNMYCSDSGTLKKDPRECSRWHHEAARRGYAPSMATLSAQYRYGEVKDLAQSREWERRAAEAGDPNSMLYLAMRYESGDEVPRNPELAEQWYRRAEAAGKETPSSRRRENARTVAKLRAAAQAGDAEAMYELGRAHADGGYYGYGLAQDHAEARRWYGEAAGRGHAAAANNLGTLHGRGLGGPADPREAMRLYRVAAEKGSIRAMYNVASMLKRGEGSAADRPAAHAWYRVANDHIPMDPARWPFEFRAVMELAFEPCVLARQMSADDKAAAEEIYADLAGRMKSPVPPAERLAGTPQFKELCEK